MENKQTSANKTHKRRRNTKHHNYPKDCCVPKDIVQSRRLERKQHREMVRLRKTLKTTNKIKKQKHSPDIKFSIAKQSNQKQFQIIEYGYEAQIYHTKKLYDIRIRLRKTTLFYLDWFWNKLTLKELDPLLMLPMFPNCKEITESVGAFWGLQDLIDLRQTVVIVVGDGSTCRTGCLFAAYSKNVVSIDPALNVTKCEQHVLPHNLILAKETIQEWIEKWQPPPASNLQLAVVAVHAHVALQEYVSSILIKTKPIQFTLLTIECCVPQHLTDTECISMNLVNKHEYVDWNITSPCRTIKRWWYVA